MRSGAPRLCAKDLRCSDAIPIAASQVRGAATGLGVGGRRRALGPPVEPCRRRAAVEASNVTNVFLPVLEDIDEARAHLAGRTQGTGMIAVGPDGAPSPERAVDAARDANLERRRSRATARVVVVSFDDQVRVIALDGEVQHAKTRVRRARDRACAPPRTSVRDAARDVSSRAQGDVHRERGAMFGARPVLHRGPSVRRQLPAGALAGAAPCGGAGQIELSRPARHRRRRRLRRAGEGVAGAVSRTNLQLERGSKRRG